MSINLQGLNPVQTNLTMEVQQKKRRREEAFSTPQENSNKKVNEVFKKSIRSSAENQEFDLKASIALKLAIAQYHMAEGLDFCKCSLYTDAIEQFQKALASSNDDKSLTALIYLELGKAFATRNEMGDLINAINQLREGLKIKPNDEIAAELQLRIVLILKNTNEDFALHKEIIKCLNLHHYSNETTSYLHFKLGRIFQKQITPYFEEAIKHYNIAFRISHNNNVLKAHIAFHFGNTYKNRNYLGDLDLAILTYQIGTLCINNDIRASAALIFNLGCALYKRSNPDDIHEAIEAFTNASRLWPLIIPHDLNEEDTIEEMISRTNSCLEIATKTNDIIFIQQLFKDDND